MRSEFMEVEVFITDDGEMFTDEDYANWHEQKLKVLKYLNENKEFNDFLYVNFDIISEIVTGVKCNGD